MRSISIFETADTDINFRAYNQAASVPISAVPTVNRILGLGASLTNENVRRLWDLLKDNAYTLDTAVTRNQALQKLFGNTPGSIRSRLEILRRKRSGRSITSIFAGDKTSEELRLEAQLSAFEDDLAGAVRGLGAHLRKIGADIFSFQDESGIIRYVIPMDDESVAVARESLANVNRNNRKRIKNLDNLRQIV